MTFLRIFINVFIQVLSALLLIYCILSWLVPPDNGIREKVDEIIDPILDPIRAFLPNIGMFDLSPLLLLLLLQFISGILF